VCSVTTNQLLEAQEVTKKFANRAVEVRVENRTKDLPKLKQFFNTYNGIKCNNLYSKYLYEVTSYRVPGQLRNLVS